ncbi:MULTISPECIES: acetyl-CoA C-acetyltransferase [unclassified Thauera]|uniref:acetyl-CoA C-acetyltransferase n=1 Tax=unclassified Thauera TaxID=2609274 RepID=UPI0002CF3B3F|nr:MULTISPECIES: acetyl-CoA C-acetyltransferase [unclassified Thauera]ENO91635.1 acyl-CoA thiolase [Thauera sp. 28]WBL63821.1 acetyl-CoA C-acetyltransferase [Thauera sp. WB-2]HAG75433.1 acetyl-CoA C-acyltransferase [Thauera sp.]HRJ22946.1 acetyl-CoA C-acetyltransferase [Thauera sp.]HRK11343.1 acetyl-CoA C-acetyltransferase [Thauera sp.]
MSDPVVIVSVARTPLGGFQGELSSLTTPQLGAIAIKAAVERARLAPEQVQEVIMGCVLPAGLGQAPARQAVLGAGLPLSAGCTTINKVCGSGMKATMLAHDLILAGSNEVMVAGGMESMSNAPYLLPKARGGYRLGHGQMFDHMFLDGLEDSYSKENKGRLMGTFAEDCASHFSFSRQAQDEFAIASTTRAQAAINNGDFTWEVAPVTVPGRKGDVLVDKDEQPLKAQIDKIPGLKPAFKKDGTVTPANSSSISDGAAALVLMRRSTADKLGLKPVATIVGHATHAQEPQWFTTAPVGAMQKVLAKAGWSTDDVDLWEINEAFAVVTMAAMHEMKLPHDKVNVNGGACSLGHPIGASGARILVTLIGALRKRGLKRGVASLCIGGGEATAMAIEVDTAVACG